MGFEPMERYERSADFKSAAFDHSASSPNYLAPQDGLEPPTQALTVPCSTTELLGNKKDCL